MQRILEFLTGLRHIHVLCASIDKEEILAVRSLHTDLDLQRETEKKVLPETSGLLILMGIDKYFIWKYHVVCFHQSELDWFVYSQVAGTMVEILAYVQVIAPEVDLEPTPTCTDYMWGK